MWVFLGTGNCILLFRDWCIFSLIRGLVWGWEVHCLQRGIHAGEGTGLPRASQEGVCTTTWGPVWNCLCHYRRRLGTFHYDWGSPSDTLKSYILKAVSFYFIKARSLYYTSQRALYKGFYIFYSMFVITLHSLHPNSLQKRGQPSRADCSVVFRVRNPNAMDLEKLERPRSLLQVGIISSLCDLFRGLLPWTVLTWRLDHHLSLRFSIKILYLSQVPRIVWNTPF